MCQTSLTWVFSDRPLRTTESNVRSSGGPGSVSTGTQASSGKSRTVSADARVPCESAKCSSKTDRGSADPPKTASRGSAKHHKWHLRVLRLPPKAHPKPVLNWANVCSPEHTSDTSTNYDLFLNWTFSSPNMVRTVQTLLHSQLACNEMQASARTCGRRAADSMIVNVG